MNTAKPIVIVGYGKMGTAIEKLLPKETLTINSNNLKSIVDSKSSIAKEANGLFGLDSFIRYFDSFKTNFKGEKISDYVAIDFSEPSEVIKNIELYAKYKINAVIGTTGWYNELENVKKIVQNSGIGLVYSSNFSDSVQMTFIANRIIAAMANSLKNWDVAINEIHHNKKLDISGTARTFATDIIKNNKIGKKSIAESINGGKPDDAITISSDRLQGVFGEHTIRYAHESGDRIELFHHADSRNGFASGAIKAADFIRDAEPDIYDYSEIARGRYLMQIIQEFGIQKIIR